MNLEQAGQIADILECTIDELAGRKPPERQPASVPINDAGMAELAHAYDSMNDEGRDILRQVASSMHKDASNRTVKDGAERCDDEGVA